MSHVPDDRPRKHTLQLLILLTACLWGGTVHGATPIPLSAEVEPESWLSRTSGPYPLHLKLTWSGPQLLEGQLRIEVRDREELRCTLLTDEMALNQGATRSTWLLPTVGRFNGSEQLELHMQWIQNGRPVWSAMHPLRVPGEGRRTMVLGLCATPTVSLQKLERLLALERLAPVEVEDRQPLMTLTPQLPPVELPNEPLQLCVYDMLLLDEVSVRTLQPAQRSALMSWVRAGGAAAIIGGEARWRREELAFVRELFREHPSGLTQNDETGALLSLDNGAEPMLLAHCGLGRVALILDTAQALERTATMNEAGRFLWRTRHLEEEQVDDVVWVRPRDMRLHFAEDPDMRTLMDDLLPRGVEAVPLWLIATVLIVYVILVGPVDYSALGLLKSRKWTWLTFPLLTLAVAMATVWITRQYLHAHGPGRSIVIRDLVEDGQVVRESRLSVLFEVAATDSVTEVSRGICYCYGPNLAPRDETLGNFGIDWNDTKMASVPLLEGRMPHTIRLRQDLPERVPFAHRVLTIPLPGEKPDPPVAFDWNRFPPPESDGLVEYTTAIRQAFGPDASAWVFEGRVRRRLCGQHALFPTAGVQPVAAPTYMRRPPGPVVSGTYSMPSPTDADLIAATTLRTKGLFQFISQIAPACDPALEDLALLDPGDPNQAVLVIAVPDDTGWTIYRRRFRRSTTGDWK